MNDQLVQLIRSFGYNTYNQSCEIANAIMVAAPQAPAPVDGVSDILEAIELLSAVFDAWENGDDCYENGDYDGLYMGKAFRLDDDVFNRCCYLLNRVNPPRNAPTC